MQIKEINVSRPVCFNIGQQCSAKLPIQNLRVFGVEAETWKEIM